MHQKVLKTLEYNKIIEMLILKIRSEPGRVLAQALAPETDIDKITELLDETEEAYNCLIKNTAHPISSFADITTELLRLKMGAPLSGGEILKVQSVLKASVRAKKGVTGKHLTSMADNLFIYRDMIDTIENAIISDTEVSDSASKELKSIRQKILRENDAIRNKLNSIIKNADTAKYLQDSLITMRSGRYVVPVRAEHKSSIKGLVHDQSASGQTLFIEPIAVLEANNRLRQLKAEEEAEIARILLEISADLQAHFEEIDETVKILGKLDLIFAKAELAISMDAFRPIVNDEGKTDIRSGRHPLIDVNAVVPVSLQLGYEYKGLVITGPNTGGKTVTLKLTGLLQLMAQSGLFITAKEGSTLTVYKKIFADIGDEQSIEQSLSTFSSHIKNIKTILRYADTHSLVLLDELGAGTDPQEGAALASAILEELRDKNVYVLATTHFSEIKTLAAEDKYFENAGMEFNIETLTPTYRLFIGASGASNAFLISERLGVPNRVINRAKEHMSPERLHADELIIRAEKMSNETQKLYIEAEELKEETKKKLDEAERGLNKANELSEKIVEEAREKARDILKDMKNVSEQIIDELKRSGNSMREVTSAAALAREKIKDVQQQYEGRKIKREHVSDKKLLLPGTEVKILSLNTKATVITPPDGKGNLQVISGIIKMNVNMEDLQIADTKKEQQSSSRARLTTKPVSMSIDVRGKNVDEALIEVDKYLDDAYLYGLNEVSIIHGKGTGVLRQGIREYLKRTNYVSSIRDGKFGEGDMGVTIVEIRR